MRGAINHLSISNSEVMKGLFVKTVRFLLPLFILAYPLDLLLSKYLSRSSKFPAEQEVMNAIYEGRTANAMAIYGSSRAWVQVDPRVLQDSLGMTAYNFGIDGHHFWLQYLRHLEYLKHNSKPAYIVLSLDVFSLEIRKDLFNLTQFLPYMLWNKNIRTYTTRYNGFSWIDYWVPLVRYIGKREAITEAWDVFWKGPTPTFRDRGFRGMDKEWTDDLERAKYERREYRIKLHDESIRLFERFINECDALGIELILVCAPEYIEGQQFMINRHEVIGMYGDYAKMHGLQFLDFSDDDICMDRSLFYNSLHLNKLGAERFSRKLASVIGNRFSDLPRDKGKL